MSDPDWLTGRGQYRVLVGRVSRSCGCENRRLISLLVYNWRAAGPPVGMSGRPDIRVQQAEVMVMHQCCLCGFYENSKTPSSKLVNTVPGISDEALGALTTMCHTIDTYLQRPWGWTSSMAGDTAGDQSATNRSRQN
jgi:hypothetical protein